MSGLDIARRLAIKHEGLKLTAYRDVADKWTIGYGSTRGVREGVTITQVQAEERLVLDLADASAAVDRLVTVPLTDGQRGALIDFAFNLGADKLAHSTLLVKLNRRDYKGACAELPRWVYAGGEVQRGLVRRRADDQIEFNR